MQRGKLRHNRMQGRKKWLYKMRPYCAACKEKLPAEDLQIDHIQPRGMDGKDDVENLQLLCDPCHKQKTLKDTEAIRKFQIRQRKRKKK